MRWRSGRKPDADPGENAQSVKQPDCSTLRTCSTQVYIQYNMQMGARTVLMTKGRLRRPCQFLGRERVAEKTKNRITDENVTGILALGEKFAFVSRPSGKSKNWRERRREKRKREKKMSREAISL